MLKKIYEKTEKYGLLQVLGYIIKRILKEIKVEYLRRNIEKFQQKIYIKDNYISQINFFYSKENLEKIKFFYEKNTNIRENILKEAKQILEHKFDLLGSGEVDLGEKIKWNEDFKSGFIWKNQFYKDIKIVDLNNNADVKVPWELSRFQHLFTLGKAYWITNNKKYYLECKEEIEEWIVENPVYMSVNWTCAMDVAIRAVNWIFFYWHFKDLIDNDKEFLNKFNNSLYNHGKFIYLNLEKGLGLANNHYLSDLVGLFYLGIYFNKLKNNEVKRWLDFSKKELEKEMFVQNNKDGSNYESSTSYHRLVTELMFFPMILGEKNKIKFSQEYKERLEKMFEFLAKIIKPNGKIPMIGDVDNGRLLIISNYSSWEVNDVRELLSLGGEYFNSFLLKSSGAIKKEDKLWIFTSLKEEQEKYYDESVKFENGGYYILRNQGIYCFIRCGELSCRGQGGHSHNDQLSFELNIGGEDFIVDTGTGVYTADKNIRNLFRSTRLHNTIYIEGYEQNYFDEDNLFEMKEESFSKCTKFSDTYFEGYHQGYLKKINTIHKRKIKLKDKSIEVDDSIENFEGVICLNLDPKVRVIKTKDGINLLKNNKEIVMEIFNQEVEIFESKFSTKYGEIQNNKRIEIRVKNKSKINFRRKK
ncbi:alginate lyase family protein [uncultured Fusobacterium sp.]|uniref:alginate lyase family protein n=1 Tax=uncultured Fusobacterium sp. TaxID=159267 RepID=UPI0025EBC2D2|nr:alginate lyase family protein [uncultured Fusobacterium sp.]